jgi:hypothetical protein
MSRESIREYIVYVVNDLLNEYVVPMGFSLESWKKHKKDNKTTNAEYHRLNPEKKWKVVHGHKRGEVGKPLKGLTNLSYEKANDAHKAIVMSGK